MASNEKTPGTCDAEGLGIVELGGSINSIDSLTVTDIQASRLSRLYALSFSTACTVASLAYAVSR